jgi:hypothetical protein
MATIKLLVSVSPVGILDCLFFGTDSLVLVITTETLVSESTIVSYSRTLETYLRIILGCLSHREGL